MSLLDPTPKHRAVRFILWALCMAISSALVGYYTGKPRLTVMTPSIWLALLAPCVLLPLKPVVKS